MKSGTRFTVDPVLARWLGEALHSAAAGIVAAVGTSPTSDAPAVAGWRIDSVAIRCSHPDGRTLGAAGHWTGQPIETPDGVTLAFEVTIYATEAMPDGRPVDIAPGLN